MLQRKTHLDKQTNKKELVIMSAIHFLKLGRDSIPHNKWICAQVIYVNTCIYWRTVWNFKPIVILNLSTLCLTKEKQKVVILNIHTNCPTWSYSTSKATPWWAFLTKSAVWGNEIWKTMAYIIPYSHFKAMNLQLLFFQP